MNRITMMLLFLSVFTTIYFGMHFYVFSRLSGLLSIEHTIWYWILMVFLTLSLPLSSWLERTVANGATRIFYFIGGTWLGVLFFLMMALLVFEVINLLFHPPAVIAAWTILSIIAVVSIGSIINAAMVNVQEVTIEIPNLDREYHLVQITDLHLGSNRGEGWLQKIVDITNDLDPEFVVITGDLFDSSRKLENDEIAPLNDLTMDSYFITGNHEVIEGLDYVFPVMETVKTRVLRDEVVKYDNLQIIGIDWPTANREGEGTKMNILDDMDFDRESPSIVLYHSPKSVDAAVRNKVSLFLAGHTHAGQIFPFNLIEKPLYTYMKGYYKKDDLNIYVSPGTGTWGPYMRLGSRNEITDIRLVPG